MLFPRSFGTPLAFNIQNLKGPEGVRSSQAANERIPLLICDWQPKITLLNQIEPLRLLSLFHLTKP